MNLFNRFCLAITLLLIAFLGGCASTDTVRGHLSYDLRPEGARPEVVWPKAPDTPRYRYVGELVGEPNFFRDGKAESTLTTVFNFLVGLFESYTPLVLQRPQHGVVDDTGRIYVVDTGRNAVLVFDPNPPPEDDSKNKEGHLLVWEMAAKNKRFAGPVAVALTWNGEVAVSDSVLGVVVRLNNKGEQIGHLLSDQLKRPTGLAFDPKRGWLFVADSSEHNIKVFNGSGLLVKTIGVPGEGEGEFNAPTHMAFSNDHLYVSDTLNSRVQVFTPDGARVRQFGERGLYVGNLMRPKGVALGNNDITYVVESYYGHLLAFNKEDELLLNIAGSGLTDDKFRLPSGVWTDKQGRIYIADMFNGRIVVFQFMGTSGG